MFSLLTITNVNSNLTWSLILTWFLKLSWVELVIDWFIDSLTWLNLMTGPRVNLVSEVKSLNLIMNWKVTWFMVGIDIHWKMNNRMVLAVILQSWKLNSTMRMKASRINEVEIYSSIIIDHESIILLSMRVIIIWSILPVVIRSSQRLSHACVSLNSFSVKLRMAHYISYSLFGIVCIWITVVILGLIHVFSLLGNQ